MASVKHIRPQAPPENLPRTLEDYLQLPLLPGTQETVLQALHRRNATAESVAQACQKDPVLTLQLWLLINRSLQNSGNELFHLAHGISLLGLPQTEQRVRHAAQMIAPNGGYLETIMESQLAQGLAMALIHSEPVEQERWGRSALFMRCHEWALWHQYPRVMEQRLGLLNNPDTSQLPSDIERRLLGAAITDLRSDVSEQLPLPTPLKHLDSTVLEALLDEACNACAEDRLRAWMQQDMEYEQQLYSRPALLNNINRLAQQLCHDPHSEACINTQQLLARQTHRHPNHIMWLSHQLMVAAQTPLIDWPHPGSRLLQHWRADAVIQPLMLAEQSEPLRSQIDRTAAIEAPPKQDDFDPLRDDAALQETLATFRELAQVSENGDIADVPLPEATQPQTSTARQPSETSKTRNFTPEFLELPTPDSGIIQHTETLSPRHNPESPQYEPPPPDLPPPAPFRNTTLLDDHLARLLDRGDQFQNLNQLLLFTLDTLAEGIGLQQVAIMVIHEKQQVLRSHYCHGIDDRDSLRHLSLPMDANLKQGIIGQLFKQRAGLNITSANHELVSARAPADLAPYLNAQSTALMGLFRQRTPIGLIYICDPHFQATQFQQFKQVCNATSQAVHNFAQSRYQRKRQSSKAAQ